jgi:hypothetical protein
MTGPRPKAGIEITSPKLCATEVTTISEFGTINVAGTVTVHSEVWARIYRTDEGSDAAPPADATKGIINGANYTVANVPRARGSLPGTTPDSNNRLRVWGKIGDVWEPKDIDPFCGRLSSATVNVPVSAMHCIWLSWADAQYPAGPFGEGANGTWNNYRPQGLVAPSNAVRVAISANGADTWTHDLDHGAPFTNADGYGMCDLMKPQYKNTPEYHSANINQLNAPLNKLVGIWETNNGPPPAARDQIEIGMAYAENLTAGQKTRLFLAMHDGQEWSDNSGSVNVTVVWS